MSRLVVITGASRGIGKETAARFLKENWTVWNLSRSAPDLKNVIHHPCDLSDGKALEETLTRLGMTGFKRITLVHNAAVTRPDNYATLTEEDFLAVLKLNVLAPQRINRHLIPKMPAGSSVIFIGSTLSDIGTVGRLSYVTSKHALAGMMKATCLDLAGKDIHTCLIAPGFTDTQMLREAVGHDPSSLMRTQKMSVMARLVHPAEIAELVYFCSSNPSINGAVLHANLGQY